MKNWNIDEAHVEGEFPLSANSGGAWKLHEKGSISHLLETTRSMDGIFRHNRSVAF